MAQAKPANDLQKRLQLLYEKRNAALGVLNQIRELLTKADTRRASGQGDARRWSSVIGNLEKSLGEARLRLQRCDLVIYQVECQLGIRAAGDKSVEGGAAVTDLPDDIELPLDPDKAVEQILAMSLSDLSKLTMEQVAIIHSRLPEKEIPLDLEDVDRIEARLELANQTRPSVSEAPIASSSAEPRHTMSKFQERRNQLLLRATLEKVRANRLVDVTREEKTLLANCLEMLNRRIETDAREERLKEVFRDALDKLGWAVPAG